MAERISKLPVRAAIPSFPSISISMGRARTFQGIASVLGKVTDALENQEDRRVVLEATRRGTVAGAAGTPSLTGESTLAGAAFDDAARQSFSNRIDIASRTRLAQLEIEHAVDPAGFMKAAVGYMGGMVQEINQVDPAIGAIFAQTFQLRQATSSARIGATYSTKIKNDLQGEVVQLSNTLSREAQGFAGDILSDDLQRSSLALTNYTVSRERLKQGYMQIAPDGTPIYSGEQREKALIRFDDEFLDAAGREFVNQSEDKLAALRAIVKGGGEIKARIIDEDGLEATTSFKLMDLMTSDAKERLVNHATQAANAQSRAILAQRRDEEANIKRLEKSTAKDLIEDAFSNELTVQNVTDNKTTLTPSAFENLLKIAKTGGAVVDTSQGVQSAQTIIQVFRADGDIAKAEAALMDLAGNNQITVTTLAGKMDEVASRIDRDGPKSMFHQMTNTFDDLIRTIDKLNVSPQTAFNLPIAKNEFIDWFQSFPSRVDPETGEPFNRQPAREEAEAMSFELLSQAIPKSRGRLMEGSFLGVKVPRKAITGTVEVTTRRGQKRKKAMPGLVRLEDGSLDEEATATNYFNAFPGIDPADSRSWPDELKRLFRDLKEYQQALEAHSELVDRIYGRSN